MIDIDRMVGRLVQLVKDAHLSSRLCCRRKDSIAEMIFCDNLTATECEKNTARLDALEALHIQSGIPL